MLLANNEWLFFPSCIISFFTGALSALSKGTRREVFFITMGSVGERFGEAYFYIPQNKFCRFIFMEAGTVFFLSSAQMLSLKVEREK